MRGENKNLWVGQAQEVFFLIGQDRVRFVLVDTIIQKIGKQAGILGADKKTFGQGSVAPGRFFLVGQAQEAVCLQEKKMLREGQAKEVFFLLCITDKKQTWVDSGSFFVQGEKNLGQGRFSKFFFSERKKSLYRVVSGSFLLQMMVHTQKKTRTTSLDLLD